MANKKEILITKHPSKNKLTFGQRASDALTRWAGSWAFIIFFLVVLVLWMYLNTSWLLFGETWDPYPFILLNLVLSCLAAIQAPIILMSQNRQAEKDRLKAEYDYKVNRKAEKEIEGLVLDIQEVKQALKIKSKRKKK